MRSKSRNGLFLCWLLAAPLQAEDIRSWVDADGTVHFGDGIYAPADSDVVELGPGSVIEFAPLPKLLAPPSAAQHAKPAPPFARPQSRPCTPLLQEYTDPKTGMHEQRDSGRCEEDGPAPPADHYPYDYWGGPCIAPSCIRPPPPRPPFPPRPPGPTAPQPRPGLGGTPLIPYR